MGQATIFGGTGILAIAVSFAGHVAADEMSEARSAAAQCAAEASLAAVLSYSCDPSGAAPSPMGSAEQLCGAELARYFSLVEQSSDATDGDAALVNDIMARGENLLSDLKLAEIDPGLSELEAAAIYCRIGREQATLGTKLGQAFSEFER